MRYARLHSAAPQKREKISSFENNGGKVDGTIINVIENRNEIKAEISFTELILLKLYKSKTEISLGSPIVNKNLNVVGIHVGSSVSSNEAAKSTGTCVSVQSVLTAFKYYVLQMLNGRTENELWMERINQIPANEFEHIGGGGYAQLAQVKKLK